MFTLIQSFRIHYVALLAVYFAVGLAGLTSVTHTYFLKDSVSLEASQLVAISIWSALPWSIKMVFGALIDGVPLFGSTRKSYIYLGQILVALGTLTLVDHASSRLVISHIGEYYGLLLTGLLTTTGVVISDIVVDTMAIEITRDPSELGMIQVWSRLAQMLGALSGAALTGWVASTFSPSDAYTLALVCPILAVLGTLATPLTHTVEAESVDRRVVVGGLLFGAISLISAVGLGENGTILTLLAGMVILAYLFRNLELPRTFVYALLGLFLFRAAPGIGPGLSWFYIDTLGFDKEFLGHLSLITSIFSVVSIVLLSRVMAEGSVFRSLAWIAGLVVVLSIPDIIVFHDTWNSREYARQIVLVDSSLIGPITGLSMIPLGVLIARAAPAAQRAVYISLTASLMNLALVAGDVGTQILNRVYTVTRENQAELGDLMVVSLGIGTALYLASVLLIRKGESNA